MIATRQMRVGANILIGTESAAPAQYIITEINDGKVTMMLAEKKRGRQGRWWLMFDYVCAYGSLVKPDRNKRSGHGVNVGQR